MTTRVVPFAERHRFVSEAAAPDEAHESSKPARKSAVKPARKGKLSKCPQCGAGPSKRVRSGMGAMVSVTCEACGFEYPQEPAS
jgi:uncharacterized protein (DUF983 family)